MIAYTDCMCACVCVSVSGRDRTSFNGQPLQKSLTNEMLSDYQSGFRSLHCTVSALLNVTDKWLNVIDMGNIFGLVMIDLKRTFDTVDH